MYRQWSRASLKIRLYVAKKYLMILDPIGELLVPAAKRFLSVNAFHT